MSLRDKYPALIVEALKNLPAGAQVLKTDCYNEAKKNGSIFDLWPTADVVDINKSMVTKARRRCPGEMSQIHYGDVCQLPFDNDVFDLVIDLSTLDHVADWAKALSEYIRVLKSDGWILLVVWLNRGGGGTVSEKSVYGGTQFYLDCIEFEGVLTDLFTIDHESLLGCSRRYSGSPDGFYAELHVYQGRYRWDLNI